VVIFFVVNVVNNQALNFHVPVPLHIIFRSVELYNVSLFSTLYHVQGSLLASLLLGVLLMGRTYSMQKYASVILITFGIIVCTLATNQSVSAI
jgi:UDP-xylose/UDP-N-acetylglucosamine transporter B4